MHQIALIKGYGDSEKSLGSRLLPGQLHLPSGTASPKLLPMQCSATAIMSIDQPGYARNYQSISHLENLWNTKL